MTDDLSRLVGELRIALADKSSHAITLKSRQARKPRAK